MSAISDLILQQVKAQAGNVSIPSNIKEQVLGGLSDSILGSLTQTASKAGGIDQIKNLLTGKANAATSPITSLATSIFTSGIAKKLNLDNSLSGAVSGLIPTILSKLGGILKDQDGDGDVDLNDIILSLKGGSSKKSGGLLGAATSILGGILKTK